MSQNNNVNKQQAAVKAMQQKPKVDFKQYGMLIALAVIILFFYVLTGGKLLKPMNVSNLIFQNAYVIILAIGMLLCILTGGNIDLSVGSVVCFTASIGCVMMDKGANMWLAVVAMLAIGLAIGAKLLVLALGALGQVPLWLAVAADTGVTLLCVLNVLAAMRMAERRHRRSKKTPPTAF